MIGIVPFEFQNIRLNSIGISISMVLNFPLPIQNLFFRISDAQLMMSAFI